MIFQKQDLQAVSLKPTILQITVFIVFVIVFLIISLGNFHAFQLGAWADDATYTILAESIIHSDQYGLINIPVELRGVSPFPFGYPLLLTPIVLFFPNSLDALRISSLSATLLSAGMLFWGWHGFSKRSYWWGVALAGLFLLSIATINFSRMVMSEAVFTTLCLASMLMVNKAVHGKLTRGWLFLTSIILEFVMFTRTIGLVVVASVFVYLLIMKGIRYWKTLAMIVFQMACLTGLVLIMTPVGWSGLFPVRYLTNISLPFIHDRQDRSYEEGLDQAIPDDYGSTKTGGEQTELSKAADYGNTSPVQGFIRRCVRAFTEGIRLTLLPVGGGPQEQDFTNRIGFVELTTLLNYLVFGLVAIGYIVWLRKEGLTFFVFFSIVYFGAMLCWWVYQRMLYPILPQLYFGFLLGIESVIKLGERWIKQWDRRNPGGVFIVLVVSLLLVISGFQSLKIKESRLHTGDLTARTQWIATHTDSTDVILTEFPNVDYVYGKRKTVHFYQTFTSVQELRTFLLKNHIDYILVAPEIVWQDSYEPTYSQRVIDLLPWLDELMLDGQVTLVHSSEQAKVQVYRTQFFK